MCIQLIGHLFLQSNKMQTQPCSDEIFLNMLTLANSCVQDLALEKPANPQVQNKNRKTDSNTVTSSKNQGNAWTTYQNHKYCKFLKENLFLFALSLKERKQIGIHVLMSQGIKSRNSLQCRSHHQKMLKKYESIEGIIAGLGKKTQIKNQFQPIEQMVNLQQKKSEWHIELIDYEDLQSRRKEETLWEKVIFNKTEDSLSTYILKA